MYFVPASNIPSFTNSLNSYSLGSAVNVCYVVELMYLGRKPGEKKESAYATSLASNGRMESGFACLLTDTSKWGSAGGSTVH